MCRKSLITGVAILILTVFMHSIGSGCESPTGQSGLFNKTVISSGITRQYILYVPPGYNSSKQMPLIFVFHGYSGTPEFMLSYTNMVKLNIS